MLTKTIRATVLLMFVAAISFSGAKTIDVQSLIMCAVHLMEVIKYKWNVFVNTKE